jgi:two-component system, OmpR family, phosphate regulon sensor histidine kinase PhoR
MSAKLIIERLDARQQVIITSVISSSVQSIIGKARTIRDGRLQDPDSIKRKAHDIEDEIRTIYGIAETLGLVIDPNCQLRSFADFNVIAMVNSALDDMRAVANERNILFSFDSPTTSVELWGDERALKQCVIHLLLNAIKYSFGGSFIKIFVANQSDVVHLHISNRGHELPKGEELKRIWDFGFRGSKAKELHVNGSGIGLFTTRKIVNAHHGRTWAIGQGESNTFFIEIPKMDRLKRELGFLV